VDDLTIACPRCSASVEVRYYGPCPSCRTELRRTMANVAREVEREDFVPAMHVVPNAVASKE
jgi:hypothetical protein